MMQPTENRGWTVTIAGVGINLALVFWGGGSRFRILIGNTTGNEVVPPGKSQPDCRTGGLRVWSGIGLYRTAGRIIAGVLTDKIGPTITLVMILLFQATLMFAAIPIVGTENSSALLLVLLATFIGFNYGTNLSLFPLFTKNLWGLKNFGTNYGIVFTAWGGGGFVMSGFRR